MMVASGCTGMLVTPELFRVLRSTENTSLGAIGMLDEQQVLDCLVGNKIRLDDLGGIAREMG
jgi:hypothetical protein